MNQWKKNRARRVSLVVSEVIRENVEYVRRRVEYDIREVVDFVCDEASGRIPDGNAEDVYDEADAQVSEFLESIKLHRWESVLELEVGDLARFRSGDTYYVKGTNGGTTLDSCELWVSSTPDDDRGFFFRADSLVGVVRRSGSHRSVMGNSYY